MSRSYIWNNDDEHPLQKTYEDGSKLFSEEEIAAMTKSNELDAPSSEKPVVWRLRCGGQNLWSYCDLESDADFYIKQSGVRKYEKQALFLAPLSETVTHVVPATVELKVRTLEREIADLEMRLMRKAEQAALLESQLAEARKALSWLEDNSTLHKRVGILYVVDGYELQVEDESGNVVSGAFHGETIEAAAIRALKENGNG